MFDGTNAIAVVNVVDYKALDETRNKVHVALLAALASSQQQILWEVAAKPIKLAVIVQISWAQNK